MENMKFAYVKTKKDLKFFCDYFSKYTEVKKTQVVDGQEVEKIEKIYKVLGLDVETTAFEPRDGEISLIQISDGKKTIVLDCFALLDNEGLRDKPRKEQWVAFEDLKVILEDLNIRIVIHNAKFEHKWLLECCGIEVQPIFCSFLAVQLIDYNEQNDPKRKHNLAAVAKLWLNVDLDKTEQVSDWSIRPLTDEQLEYAALDPYYLPALREVLLQELINENLLKVAKIEFECAPVVAEMELRGIKVNREKYQGEISKLIELREQTSIKLQADVKNDGVVQGSLFGDEQNPFCKSEVDFGAVLLSSPAQMQNALVKHGVPVFSKKQVVEYTNFMGVEQTVLAMTPTDRIRYMKEFYPKFNESEYKRFVKAKKERVTIVEGTGAKALKPIQNQYPILSLLSDFRSTDKLVTAFGESFLAWLKGEAGNERVYPNFFIIGAPTGRFACKYPNVQQVPDKSISVGGVDYPIHFREAFDFPDGYVGINADYSQIELRIATEFSGDPIFMDAFISGKDLHADTASRIFNVPYEYCNDEHHEFYKKYRKPSKNINFGVVYGIGAYGLSGMINTTEEEAQEMINGYARAYPTLWAYLKKQANIAISTLRATTASGRIQKFTPPSMDEMNKPVRSEVATIGRNGMNMPIQGCLTNDSRVLIEGQGYVKIGETPKEQVNVWDSESMVSAFVMESGLKKLTTIKFSGGNSIECSPDHKFWTKVRGKEDQWVKASDLAKHNKVAVSLNTPEFSFLDKSKFNYLGGISDYEIGTLAGIYYLYGGYVIDLLQVTILESKTEIRAELENLFKKVGVVYDEDVIIKKRGTIHTQYKVISRDLIEDLERIVPEQGFTKYFWQSKQVMRGFLRVVFTNASMFENTFDLSVKDAETARDIQQALFLFGIVSNFRTGLMTDYVSLSDLDLKKFILNIGIVKSSDALQAVSYESLKKVKKGERESQSYLTVMEVKLTDEMVEMYDIADSDTNRFMANGLVTHNTSADILKRALKILRDYLRPYDAYIVNIVHDEITVECNEKDAEVVRPLVEQAMTEAAKEFLTKVPVKVDAKIIRNWGDK